ncbi:hypothetical protein W02_42630 [Nitrospira sp. KM1]|uniref:hypothetical protein n=1 Tax=Nitrospira sp. KM1 TaxID=1936990 RepID=UPI0013A772DE|nr:hypothetical protein [Nitrospira sp. KM1]BCA57123.1 hypothetical protein W02_42630 [Nitrospira sp. KM1]
MSGTAIDLVAISLVVCLLLAAGCGGSDGTNGGGTSGSDGPQAADRPTYYIDPTCAVNGNGTTTTCGVNGPFNSWKSVAPWAAGNVYAGKGGASEVTNLGIPVSGSPGAPITITSYGAGQFTFVSTGAIPLYAHGRDHLVFDNIAVRSSATHCLYFGGVGSDILVQNSTFLSCGADGVGTAGVTVDAENATALYTHFVVHNNNFTDIVGPAFAIHISSANQGAWEDLAITNNNMTNVDNGASSSGAIIIIIETGATATYSNITITHNDLTRVNDELDPAVSSVFPPASIKVSQSVIDHPIATARRFFGVNISNNTITDGAGGIYGSYWGSAPTAPRNTISHNTVSNVYTAAAIGFNAMTDVLVSSNDISSISTGKGLGYWDGMGLDIDYGSSQIEAAHNLIRDCLGQVSNLTEDHNTPGELSGQGIITFSTNSSIIHGNLLVRNRHGLVVGDETNLDLPGFSPGPNVWANNTVVGSTFSGIGLVRDAALPQIHTFVNNIVVGSGAAGHGGYGFRNGTPNPQIMTTNLFFNNASGDYLSQPLHPTDITGKDPLFLGSADYRLQPASPARAVGTYWGPQCSDIRGTPCVAGQVSLGAYQ